MPHTSTACAFCSTKDPYTITSIKEFQKIKMPLVRAGINKASECKHKPFVCEFCYGDWYYRQGFWKTFSLDATHLQETKEKQANLSPPKSKIEGRKDSRNSARPIAE